MIKRVSAVFFVLLLLGSACTEERTPLDLDGSVPEVTVPESNENDPNAESRALAIQLAEQQCFDDPTKEEGLVQVADPASGSVVAEIRVDCASVRSGSESDE